jgi:mRNA-degrading endonuclease toxin of MazEF toxin-antitoxin module
VSDANGLKEPSEVQVDKVQSLRRDRIERVVGYVPPSIMLAVDVALRRWFDLS